MSLLKKIEYALFGLLGNFDDIPIESIYSDEVIRNIINIKCKSIIDCLDLNNPDECKEKLFDYAINLKHISPLLLSQILKTSNSLSKEQTDLLNNYLILNNPSIHNYIIGNLRKINTINSHFDVGDSNKDFKNAEDYLSTNRHDVHSSLVPCDETIENCLINSKNFKEYDDSINGLRIIEPLKHTLRTKEELAYDLVTIPSLALDSGKRLYLEITK